MATQSSVQRSFRLAHDTADDLDATAASTGETRNALADRLLREALRIERHPLIRFAQGPARRREPALVGTRLKVRDIITTLRNHGDDGDAVAAYLELPRRTIDAAIAYYGDHADEVDADIAWAEGVAQREREQWERQRAALA